MPDSTIEPIGLGSTTLDVASMDVSDELGRAGVAFGDLVRLTGQAVADTQVKLNATGVDSTSALATTQVDVIAATETVYDENGNIDRSNVYARRLPLINFIDPVIYEWSGVRLQGRFFAREFATASSQSSGNFSQSDSDFQGGLLLLFGAGRVASEGKTTTTDTDRWSTADSSVGSVRMNAELRPRYDVGVPKPRQSIQGPHLAVLEGAIEDLPTATPPARTMTAVIQYFRRDGSPITGKILSVETDGVPWTYQGPPETDTEGKVTVQLRREFLDDQADRSPVDVVVSARKGMVSNSTTVTF